MTYEELAPIPRSQAAAELASEDWERISLALLRLALHDPDPEWLQSLLLGHLRHQHEWVRGVAALGLGHVARIHGWLKKDEVVPALQELLGNPSTRGKAEDALEDIAMYVVSDSDRSPSDI